MRSRLAVQMIGGLLLLALVAPPSWAAPLPGRDLVREALEQFDSMNLEAQILDAARNLFWSLATISLVWTMGALILRQDVGEMLMELLRFIVVTGTYYWLLINASNREGGEGFVGDIVGSFFQMSNGSMEDSTIRSHASGLLSRGLNVFYRVIAETHGGSSEDQFLSGSIALLILVMCSLMAAQFVVALVTAWMLSYAGIFLLGFGGARWTSPIAISFYKHAVAVGVALLALSFIGVAATRFLDAYDHANESTGLRSAVTFPYLGGLLAAIVLMMVLSIRVPQILFTLVTGSPLGMFTGAATVAGHALAVGGTAAWSSAMNALPNGGGDGSGTHRRGADAVMDAVQRSAGSGAASDAFHVNAGSDPFGITRSSDPHREYRAGSAFVGTESVERPVTDSGHARAPKPANGSVEVGTTTSTSDRPNRSMPIVEADSSPSSASRTVSPGASDSTTGDVVTQRPDYEAELGAIEAAKNGAGVASLTAVEVLQAGGDERNVAELTFDSSITGDVNGLAEGNPNHLIVDEEDVLPRRASTVSTLSSSADALTMSSVSSTTLQDANAAPAPAPASAIATERLGDIRIATGITEEVTTPAIAVDPVADPKERTDSSLVSPAPLHHPTGDSRPVNSESFVAVSIIPGEDHLPVTIDSNASPRHVERVSSIEIAGNNADAVPSTHTADADDPGDRRNSTQHLPPVSPIATPEDDTE